jgi:hypothetical protein
VRGEVASAQHHAGAQAQERGFSRCLRHEIAGSGAATGLTEERAKPNFPIQLFNRSM